MLGELELEKLGEFCLKRCFFSGTASGEGSRSLVSWEKRVLGRGNGMCKGPEVRMSLACLRDKKEDQGEFSPANSMGSDTPRVER